MCYFKGIYKLYYVSYPLPCSCAILFYLWKNRSLQDCTSLIGLCLEATNVWPLSFLFFLDFFIQVSSCLPWLKTLFPYLALNESGCPWAAKHEHTHLYIIIIICRVFALKFGYNIYVIHFQFKLHVLANACTSLFFNFCMVLLKY